MRKFLRNLFSGYFLVLLMLLVEIAVFFYMNFFLDDLIARIIGDESGNINVQVIVSLIYLTFKVFIFVVAVIIFFKIE